MDVMGIAFRRELYLSTRQVFPPLQDRDKAIHTKIQAKLLRKLGEHAYPFFFEVSSRRSAGGRSRLRQQTCVCLLSFRTTCLAQWLCSRRLTTWAR